MSTSQQLQQRRIVHRAASSMLCYPDAGVLQQLPAIEAALLALPHGIAPRASLVRLLQHLSGGILADLQRHYVDVFDLTSKRCLYLSYYTDGDTRRRGAVLAEFKVRYRASGFLVDTGGELPDYLPLVLEYAAVADPTDGMRMLQDYRPSIELLRLALLDLGTPYAAALEAVCKTLPGPSPTDTAAVMRMAQAGPPREEVGLEPVAFGAGR
jgi:nitrate reductase molybdenum cofactor assembly chaperone NarJ/NarW